MKSDSMHPYEIPSYWFDCCYRMSKPHSTKCGCRWFGQCRQCHKVRNLNITVLLTVWKRARAMLLLI
mgnify:CR=1 FL=1